MKIGKARVGAVATKKYFKLEKGDNVYRILPPLGDLADKGIWAVYHKVHYGYRGLPGLDGKAKMRVFSSPEVVNRKTRMIEVPDAAKERLEKIKQALGEAKDRGDAEGVKQLSGLLRTYNLDSKWYVNAVNLQGEIGLLKIPHKAKQALESEIQRLAQENVDPLGVENGRYFVFQRTGDGRDTQYQVKVYKQKIEVQGLGVVEKDMPHTLTEDVISRLENESHKLDQLFKKPTAEQVARMVQEGATAVEEILGRNQSSEEEVLVDEEEDVDQLLMSSPVSQSTQQPTSRAGQVASVSLQATSTPSAVAAKSMKIGTASAAAPSTAAAPVQVPAADQTPEEFLKSIGLG